MVNRKITDPSSNTAILPFKEQVVGQNIRILLVDDRHSISEILSNHLASQPDFEIVESLNNTQSALEQIKTLNPSIVLMNIEMPGVDGFKIIRAIAQQFPNCKIIALSRYVEESHLKKALNAGAKGYLLKTNSAEELIHGIRFVNQGYLHFSPGLFEKLESEDKVKSSPKMPSLTRSPSEIVSATPSRIQPHDWSSQTKELMDHLPRVWTRGLLYFLVIFAAIALPWSMLSKVDETGTARGRLEPSGKTFILDAPVAGTVAAIKVQEGEVVEAGQSLLELESDIVNAELQQLQTQLVGQQNRLDQLELLKEQLLLTVNTQEQESHAQKLEKQSQIAQAKQQVQFHQNSHNSEQAEKLAQVNQAKQTVAYSQTAFNSAKNVLAKAEKEIERYRQAWKQGVIAEVQVVEQENFLAEKQQAYDQAQSELQQAKLRLAEEENNYAQVVRQAESDIEQAQLQLQEQQKSDQTLAHTGKLAILKSQEQLKNIESEITTLTAEIAQSKSEIASTQYQLTQRVLKAPVKGRVFSLPIQKSGKVVQPGDAIAEIAPENSSLMVRAEMATAESGSLTKGMPVKLKFDAYPFQDYGIVTGKLTMISPTSQVTDTEQGQVANYDLEVTLDHDCIPTANKCIALRPGDTATAEVIVRQRRVIDFILDPFKKLRQGGLEL